MSASDWVSFSEIKSRITLEQVLRDYRVLDWLRRSAAEQYRGRCPIHQGEGTEAFHANLARNMFHCFACGAGGNVLDFVAAMESCSVREAALRLQSSAGSSGRTAHAASGPRRKKLVTKKRYLNPTLDFVLDLDATHSYLAQRGINPATASHFGAGYYGRRGLMSGRIAIPIHDPEGRLIAYCGRAVNGAVVPRYRFPAGFQKAQVLFNYHRARAAGGDRLVLVEGFFDCMRVHQAGFACVAALMGARLSAAQKQLLTGFRTIVLLLDGDATGRAATAQIANDLGPTCSVIKILLAPDLQPDQLAADQIRHILAGHERR